jgi:hypothetical protein
VLSVFGCRIKGMIRLQPEQCGRATWRARCTSTPAPAVTVSSLWCVHVFTGHRRFITMVSEVDEKLRRCKSHWLSHGTRMNNRMAKIMLNCRPNGRRGLGKAFEETIRRGRNRSIEVYLVTDDNDDDDDDDTEARLLTVCSETESSHRSSSLAPARCLFAMHCEMSAPWSVLSNFPSSILHAPFIFHTRSTCPTYLRCQILIKLLISEALFDAS